MRLMGIAILLIILWLVVCMPELNSALDSTDEGLRTSALLWESK